MFAFCQQRVGVPPPPPLSPTLAVCVCRLRLILPHSFGSNLSCHAVIMTNKKRELGKKLFIENDYALRAGQVEALFSLLHSPRHPLSLSLGFFPPLMIR